jgi:hypothetical protein
VFPGSGECVPSGAARSIKKDRQFLAKWAIACYGFSEMPLLGSPPVGEAAQTAFRDRWTWPVKKLDNLLSLDATQRIESLS